MPRHPTHSWFPPPPLPAAHAAIVNLPRCEGGLGDGCEAMSASEGELVKQLQARSAKNYVRMRVVEGRADE